MSVAYQDLREFIALADQLGAVRHISGAQVFHEIGGVTEVAAGLAHAPALLFDNIPGYRSGFRVFTNATTNAQRAALALGLDPTLRPTRCFEALEGEAHRVEADCARRYRRCSIHGKFGAGRRR